MSKKKKQNRLIRERIEKERYINEHPNECLCDDPVYDKKT